MTPRDPLHSVATAQENRNRLCNHENTPAIKLPPPGAAGGWFGRDQVVDEVLGLVWTSDKDSMNKKMRVKYG